MIDPDYADVGVDWYGIDNGQLAFKYSMTPNFTSAVMITKVCGTAINDQSLRLIFPNAALFKVIEFDDPENRGVYDGHSEVKEYDTSNLTWKREVIRNTPSTLAISFLSSLGSNSSDETSLIGGSINITLAAYADRGFGIWLPHISHSNKTNQFDIQLKNITTNSGFNFSRFGLEMVLVAGPNTNLKIERRRKYTNDDEHTPGTFEVGGRVLNLNYIHGQDRFFSRCICEFDFNKLLFPPKYDELVVVNAADNDLQSYMQWKPIVYNSEERAKLATMAHMSDSTNVIDPKKRLNGTMLYNFYGDQLDAMLVRKFNVTFGKAGKPGDASGFYKTTRFHAW